MGVMGLSCPACCAAVHVASRSSVVGAVSSTSSIDADGKITRAKPPKLPSPTARKPQRKSHLMRDGEQRNSFEMTGSAETLSTSTLDAHTPQSTARKSGTRHLWHNSSQSLSDEALLKAPYGISASCEESFSPEPASPTILPSKAARRALIAGRNASREASRAAASESSKEEAQAITGALGSDAEPAVAPDASDDAAAMDSEVVSALNEAPGRMQHSDSVSTNHSRCVEESESEDAEDQVTRKRRPKKLWTHESAIVRTLSRQGWNAVAQQPFQSRHFLDQQLSDWTAVNSGQLLGFASQKGGQPRRPCQDEYAILHEAGYQIYLVVDGHGAMGESVAQFARRWLVSALLALVRQRDGRVLANGELAGLFADLHRAALNAEAAMVHNLQSSGFTATVAIVTPGRSLRGAWLGNCQCLAGIRHETDAIRNLAPPHTAATSAGMPMGVTRGIGYFTHGGLSHEAEEFIEADVDHAGLDFIILGTGGLWRGLSKARVLSEVSKAGPYFAQHACSRVATLSQDTQTSQSSGPMAVEDATVIVVWVGGNVSDVDVK